MAAHRPGSVTTFGPPSSQNQFGAGGGGKGGSDSTTDPAKNGENGYEGGSGGGVAGGGYLFSSSKGLATPLIQHQIQVPHVMHIMEVVEVLHHMIHIIMVVAAVVPVVKVLLVDLDLVMVVLEWKFLFDMYGTNSSKSSTAGNNW